MENGHFEDVFPIENGDIPASYVSLPVGIYSPGDSKWPNLIPEFKVFYVRRMGSQDS